MDKWRPSEQFAIVNRFRRRAPVDVEGLAFALGVPVHYARLPDDISGMIEPDPRGSYRIVVNEAHPRTRQRFTIAMNSGILSIHRDLIERGIGDDRAYRSADTGRYRNSSIGPKQETEANKFAANVLMPMDLIDEIRNEDRPNNLAGIARRLEVSEHAPHIRMGIPYEPPLVKEPERRLPLQGLRR